MDFARRSVVSDPRPLDELDVVGPVDRHEEPVAGEGLDVVSRGHDADAGSVCVDDVDVAAPVRPMQSAALGVVPVLGPTLDGVERVQDAHGRSSHRAAAARDECLTIRGGQIEIRGDYTVEGFGTTELRFYPRRGAS